jgi:PilZ domain
MLERRRAPRVKVNLPARWEGVLTLREAAVTSLSINGCFVLTGGKVQPKELIRLEINLSADQVIYLWSEVVDEAEEIGFAVRFTSLNDEEQEQLDQFIKQTLAAA